MPGEISGGSCKEKEGFSWSFIDYSELNKRMKAEKFPIPMIKDILDGMAGTDFSTNSDFLRAIGKEN